MKGWGLRTPFFFLVRFVYGAFLIHYNESNYSQSTLLIHYNELTL